MVKGSKGTQFCEGALAFDNYDKNVSKVGELSLHCERVDSLKLAYVNPNIFSEEQEEVRCMALDVARQVLSSLAVSTAA